MPWIKNTGCKYHSQDTDYYCGAATAMMVLAEIGVGHASLDQDDLYTSNNTHNVQSGWYSDPEGLRFTMVDRKPAAFTNTFVVYRESSEPTGSRKLVYTLQHYGVSPIVLVFGCAHWIVVCGVQTDVNPATGPYTIDGFWVNNPVYEDNEPHSSGDICGSGSSHGVENQWISYATWQSTYLTGCNYDSPTSSLQYISVCDPDEPKIAMPRQLEPVRYYNGRSVIEPRAVAGVLRKELERLSLNKARPTAKFAAGRFGQPILVHRLDDERKFYHLTPSVAGSTLLGYAQTDALYGSLESIFPMKRGVKIFEFDPKKIELSLIDRRIELPNEKGRFRLVKGKFKVERELVWRPCRQSYSPHLPFWRIVAGPLTFYRRIDGPVFAQLTLNGRGI